MSLAPVRVWERGWEFLPRIRSPQSRACLFWCAPKHTLRNALCACIPDAPLTYELGIFLREMSQSAGSTFSNGMQILICVGWDSSCNLIKCFPSFCKVVNFNKWINQIPNAYSLFVSSSPALYTILTFFQNIIIYKTALQTNTFNARNQVFNNNIYVVIIYAIA